MKPTIFTIGYEGVSQTQVLGVLIEFGVSKVLDVRLRPASRKCGLSKTALDAGLRSIGISYEHRRELGTPAELLAAGPGRYDVTEYLRYLAGIPWATEAAAMTASTERTALLCFEADPGSCHRSVIAAEAAAMADLRVVHL